MRRFLLIVLPLFCACGADLPLDGRDDSFAGPKADGFCAEPGSVEAEAVLAVVNDPAMSMDKLDQDVRLDKRAAAGIVEARPFASLEELDAVSYVGPNACGKILDYACDVAGLCSGDACSAESFSAPPPPSGFGAQCAATLIALANAPLLESVDVEVDALSRCQALPRPARVAFDLAADSRGLSASELGEPIALNIRNYEIEGRGASLVDVRAGGELTRVLAVGDAPVALWSSDGGSAFFGCGEEPRDDPADACLAGLLSGGCAETSMASHQLTATVAATVDESPMIAAAVAAYAERLALASDVPVSIDISVCSDQSRGFAAISTEDLPPAIYSLVTDDFDNVWLATTHDIAPEAELSCTQM